MWHVYAYDPAVVNWRSIDTFALVPAMSAGAPACAVKNTLCATEPKAKVTVSPAFTVSVAGVKVSEAVAATLLPAGGGGGPPEPPVPYVLPQPKSAPVRVIRTSR